MLDNVLFTLKTRKTLGAQVLLFQLMGVIKFPLNLEYTYSMKKKYTKQ